MNYWIVFFVVLMAIAFTLLYATSGTNSKAALFGLVIYLFLTAVFLYYYITNSQTKLASSMYLLNANPAISSALIASPLASSYSYSCWVYVNSWNTTTPKRLFAVQDATTQQNLLSAELGGTDMSLKTTVWSNNQPISVIGTTNFPIQKWTLLIVSVDGSVLDIYLDGKLTTSSLLQNSNRMNVVGQTSTNPQIMFGTGVDIYLSSLVRSTTPATPTSAWALYQRSNGLGLSMFGINGFNYGAEVSVTQNNVPMSSVKLF